MTAVGDFMSRYERLEAEGRTKWLAAVETADPRDVETVLKHFSVDLPAQLWDSVGSPDEEIEAIREKYSGWLPASIEAYLRLFGRHTRLMDGRVSCTATSILQGESGYMEWKKEVQSPLHAEWYGDGSRFAIPEEAFHLGGHGGCVFYYILDRDDDPEVYMMLEGQDRPDWPDPAGVSSLGIRFSESVFDSFSEKTDLLISKIATAKTRRGYREAREP
jgi:hypothetical protein